MATEIGRARLSLLDGATNSGWLATVVINTTIPPMEATSFEICVSIYSLVGSPLGSLLDSPLDIPLEGPLDS